MRELAISRLILAIVCGSYVLSAALLTWARLAGQTVPAWRIGGWIVTGIIGAILVRWLSADRPIISISLFLVLAPWMALAFVDDARGRHFFIAIIDLAGIFAIIYALWAVRTPMP